MKTIVIAFTVLSSITLASPARQASRLFDRLASRPLKLDDPRRPLVEKLLSEGKALEAARIASDDDGFFNTTLRHWSSALWNRAENRHVSFTDFDAMIIGTVKDDRDFREILYGNFAYIGDPIPVPPYTFGPEYGQYYYNRLEAQRVNFRTFLRRQEPQSRKVFDAAGVLTSDGWAGEHLNDGTNRRPVEFAFREFLCTPIADLADSSTPDHRVRRDVDRVPGGDAETYPTTCRRCHGGLDSLSGAYAYTFRDQQFMQVPGTTSSFYVLYVAHQEKKVLKRMNRNGEVYPAGFITTDDSWMNQWTHGPNGALGWRGPLKGRGVSELGRMLANSRAFSRCMAKRVFRQVCARDVHASEASTVETLADKFETGGYRLRSLFEEAAVLPQCLGNS